MLRSPAVFFLRGAHPQDLVRPKCPDIRLTRQDSSDSLRPAFHAASLLRGEKPGRVLVTEAMEPPMRNSVFVSVGTALGVAVPILATGPGGSDCWTSRSTTCCKEIERGIFRSAAPNGLHCTIDPITDTDMQMLQQASSGLSRDSFEDETVEKSCRWDRVWCNLTHPSNPCQVQPGFEQFRYCAGSVVVKLVNTPCP
jgi:hypothetical protein